jgi:Ca2+-transporting ATPase
MRALLDPLNRGDRIFINFIGFAGMIDPPRNEAKAVSACIQAGIIPVMITATTNSQQKPLQSRHNHLRHVILSGTKWLRYQKRVFRYSGTCACLRVNPEQKLKL